MGGTGAGSRADRFLKGTPKSADAESVQLNNVVKKVTRAADKLGLEAGEEVAAACTTNPKGTMNRMLARELGGAIAALAAGRGDGEVPVDGGLAARFPSGQHYVVVTDRRLLACSVSAMTGKPKEIVAQWPITDVVGLVTEPGKLAIPLTIGFADGTAVAVEGARGTGADSLPAAFEQLVAAPG